MVKTTAKILGTITTLVLSATTAYAQQDAWWSFIPENLEGVGGGSLPALIATIINVMLLIAAVVAVIYLIIGGYQYITSGGNAEQAQTGRTTVLNAIIGLVIIFAAYLVVRFIIEKVVGFEPAAEDIII